MRAARKNNLLLTLSKRMCALNITIDLIHWATSLLYVQCMCTACSLAQHQVNMLFINHCRGVCKLFYCLCSTNWSLWLVYQMTFQCTVASCWICLLEEQDFQFVFCCTTFDLLDSCLSLDEIQDKIETRSISSFDHCDSRCIINEWCTRFLLKMQCRKLW